MALTKIKTGSVSDSITLTTPTIDGVLTANGGAVFNEASADVDFRVESDGDTHALFVEGSSGNVGIGVTPSAAYKMQVNVATNTVTTGSPASSSLVNIAGGTPTVGDGVSLQLTNTSGAKETAWRISAVTASGNNGDLVFNGYAGGSDYPERMRIDSSGKVAIGSTVANKIFNIADPAQGGEALKLHFEANASADKWAIYAYDRTNGHYANMSFGANSLAIDSSGRVTMPSQPVFSHLGIKAHSISTTGTQVMSASNVWSSDIYHALNRGAHFNASTGRFTAPVTGTYHFQFNCTYSNFASGYLYFYMNINGVAKSYMQADQQTPQSAIVNHMYCELSANDYVDCSYTTNYISGIIRFAGFSGMLAG